MLGGSDEIERVVKAAQGKPDIKPKPPTGPIWRCDKCKNKSNGGRCQAVKVARFPERYEHHEMMINPNYALAVGTVKFCVMWKVME